MYQIVSFASFILLATACQSPGSAPPQKELTSDLRIEKKSPATDTTAPEPAAMPPYSGLIYEKKEILSAAPGTKSVLFNAKGSRLYAMNLEGMSIYEFDQATRKVTHEFKFAPTRGTGWDYVKEKPIPSYEEKPVEACLSHDDKWLWVSLHNAEGIVPIRVDDPLANKTTDTLAGIRRKKIRLLGADKKLVDSFYVPLIETGKTPKVIARTADSKHLLVSNWHSYNVSILETDETRYPYAKVVETVPVSAIPRGIAVDDAQQRSYVAIMGGASLAVIDHKTWKMDTTLAVASNPRHVVMDTSGHLFVSYNRLAKVACLDAATGKTLFSIGTHAQPRTIMLSKNHRFLFVTCYSSDYVEVLKITDKGFENIASLPCKGHPVGVDIFEDADKLEAWVCSYSNGSIQVFSFRKTR